VDGVFLVLIGVIRDIRSHWWSSVEPGGVGLGGSAAVDPYRASLVGTLAGLVSLLGLAKA